MKISEIVKQIKEYRRLNDLIGDVEQYITWLGKADFVDTAIERICYPVGQSITLDHASVNSVLSISCDITELIRNDIKSILKKHLSELKRQRDGLKI